jgi:hypothetical protein
MNAKLLFPIVAFVAAGAAHAETPTVVKDDFVSTKTRAEVQAELATYKKSGVNPWSIQYNPLRAFVSKASRQDVTAAYIASRDEVAAVNGEDSGAAYFAQGGQRGVNSTTLAGTPVRAQ